MTKGQKVTQVTRIVEDARAYYSREEFVTMVNAIWDGLEIAKEAAVEGANTATRVQNDSVS